MISKACPVAIQDGAVLIFQHPLAGAQLVKGTVEAGETPQAAAERELWEEAGVTGRWTDQMVVVSDEIAPAQRWHFVPVETAPLPQSWTHHCADDGGHLFRFFWHLADGTSPADCDPVFQRALAFLHQRVALT